MTVPRAHARPGLDAGGRFDTSQLCQQTRRPDQSLQLHPWRHERLGSGQAFRVMSCRVRILAHWTCAFVLSPPPVRISIYPTMLEHLPIGTKDENWFQEEEAIFTIAPETRKHVAIFGATGTVKSTLLRNMIAWDISAGAGVSVLDPHGQLVEDLLIINIPSSRIGDVIYFNPKDLARATPLNILDSPGRELDPLVVDNAVGIFKLLWPDAFSAWLAVSAWRAAADASEEL